MHRCLSRKARELFCVFGAAAALSMATPPARAVPERTATAALKAVARGALARRAGDLLGACAAFREAMRLTPTWAAANFEFGRCLRLLGDPWQTADDHLRQAVRTLPDRPVLRLELAKQARDRGDLSSALATYRKVAALVPRDVDAAEGVAMLGPPSDETAKRLERLIAHQPLNLGVWRRLAEVYEKLGRLAEAEAALEIIVKRSVNRGASAAALGRFGVRTGRKSAIDAAKASFRR